MQPKDLQLGTVSPPTERRLVLLLFTVAALVQIAAWRVVPAETLADTFASVTLGRWGLPLLSLSVFVVLYRVLRSWLDLPTALVASTLWAIVGLAVVPAPGLWEELVGAALALACAWAAMGLAQRRRPAGSWRLGAILGVLSWFSGLAGVWGLMLLAWLPTVSRRFRGMGALRLGVEMGGAAILVFALGAILLPWVPGAPSVWPETERVLAGLHRDDLRAPFEEHQGPAAAAMDAWLGFEFAEAELDPGSSPVTKFLALQTLIWAEVGDHPTQILRSVGRRIAAQWAAWPQLSSPRPTGLLLLPWTVVVLGAWFGAAALLPSFGRYAPFFFGVGLPLVQAGICGLSVATLVLALPFYCILAGYGLVRVSVGRASLGTWTLASAILGAAWAAHHWVLPWT